MVNQLDPTSVVERQSVNLIGARQSAERPAAQGPAEARRGAGGGLGCPRRAPPAFRNGAAFQSTVAGAASELADVRNSDIRESSHLKVSSGGTIVLQCGGHMRTGWIILSTLVAACSSNQQTVSLEPSPYLLVLASDKDGAEDDFFAVIDVREQSPTRGKAIATKPYGHRNSMPHHMEYSLPDKGRLLFANAHHPEVTMLVDVSDPQSITVKKSIKPPAPFRFTHDYARLPSGNVLAGFLRSEGASPKPGDAVTPGGHGGLAEYTAQGDLLRTASAAVQGYSEPIRTYAILPMLHIDRVVTTSARMMEEHSANVVQIWRYSDLKLLKTIDVPMGKKPDGSALDWAAFMPFGPRLMHDGSVLMNTYMCGFYRLTGIGSDEPRLAHVYDIQGRDPEWMKTRVGCSVPVLVGHHWIMPVAWSQMVVVLDVSDPSSPREISRLAMERDFNSHWAAKDPKSNRIVIGAEMEKERGMYLLHYDPQTGGLAFDSTIISASGKVGYIDLEQQSWPHGTSGSARAHAALFLPK